MNIKEAIELMPYWYESRKDNIYLLMGQPGIGKTEIVRQFAKEHGINVVTLLASQSVPNEIAGTNGPDIGGTEMKYYPPAWYKDLHDGDILFMDELLTAPAQNLSACLTMMQSRILQKDIKLPDVMIVCACNYMPSSQVSAPLKNRFWKIDIECNANIAAEYLTKKYGGDANLLRTIIDEKPDDKAWNWVTPRSVEKLICQVQTMAKPEEQLCQMIIDLINTLVDRYKAEQFIRWWNDRREQIVNKETYEAISGIKAKDESYILNTLQSVVEDQVIYGFAHDDPRGARMVDGSLKIASVIGIPKDKFDAIAETVAHKIGDEGESEGMKLREQNALKDVSDYYRGEMAWSDLTYLAREKAEMMVDEFNRQTSAEKIAKLFSEKSLKEIIETLQGLPYWEKIQNMLENMALVECF